MSSRSTSLQEFNNSIVYAFASTTIDNIVDFLHKHPNKSVPDEQDIKFDKTLEHMRQPPLTTEKIAYFRWLIKNHHCIQVDVDPDRARFALERRITDPASGNSLVILSISQAATRALKKCEEGLKINDQLITPVTLSTTDSGRLQIQDEPYEEEGDYDPSQPFINPPSIQNSLQKYDDVDLNSSEKLITPKRSCCPCNLF